MLMETGTPQDSMEILIVDPDPVSRRVSMALMKRSGYSPSFAENEDDALAALGKKHYDLVIMDVDRFTRDLGEVAARITSPGGPNAVTPMLGISSGMDGGEAEKIRQTGMAGFLVKPYDFNALLDEIGRVAGPAPHTTPKTAANGWWRDMGEIIRLRGTKRILGLDDSDGHVSGSPAGRKGTASGLPPRAG